MSKQLLYLLIAIGEEAKKIDDKTRENYSSTNWKSIVGMKKELTAIISDGQYYANLKYLIK